MVKLTFLFNFTVVLNIDLIGKRLEVTKLINLQNLQAELLLSKANPPSKHCLKTIVDD